MTNQPYKIHQFRLEKKYPVTWLGPWDVIYVTCLGYT